MAYFIEALFQELIMSPFRWFYNRMVDADQKAAKALGNRPPPNKK